MYIHVYVYNCSMLYRATCTCTSTSEVLLTADDDGLAQFEGLHLSVRLVRCRKHMYMYMYMYIHRVYTPYRKIESKLLWDEHACTCYSMQELWCVRVCVRGCV